MGSCVGWGGWGGGGGRLRQRSMFREYKEEYTYRIEQLCYKLNIRERIFSECTVIYLEKDLSATCLLQIVQCLAWTQTRGSSPGREGGREGVREGERGREAVRE